MRRRRTRRRTCGVSICARSWGCRGAVCKIVSNIVPRSVVRGSHNSGVRPPSSQDTTRNRATCSQTGKEDSDLRVKGRSSSLDLVDRLGDLLNLDRNLLHNLAGATDLQLSRTGATRGGCDTSTARMGRCAGSGCNRCLRHLICL